jgi:hypothetical protein
MKKTLIIALAFAMVSTLGFSAVFAGQDETGNGAPSGPHYTLNIIGVSNPKTADMDGNSGHRIFVPIRGLSKIYLTEAEDFNGIEVIDANAFDQDGATFALPNPDPDLNGTTSYSVFVRALGKPGGKAFMQTCYTLEGVEYCADDFPDGVEQITIERKKGKSTFTNVSKDLLYIDFCAEWDTTTGECLRAVQLPLFDPRAEGYLWEYDNYGLKVAQLRFYEVPTDTPWAPPPQPAP